MPIAIILVGPSGVGKDSIALTLRKRHKEIDPSISCTTRPPRLGEKDGVAYHFLTDAQFDELVKSGDFLEWDAFHDARYGTLAQPVEKRIAAGGSVVFVVNARGAHALRKGLKARGLPCIAIFLLPPDIATLITRMQKRGDSDENIKKRLKSVKEELSHKDEFDMVIVNDNFEKAVNAIEKATGFQIECR